MIKVYIFHTGSVLVDDSIPYKQNNPLAPTGWFRGKKHKLELPVSSYLIVHPKGNILIDTGWDSEYITKKPERFCGLLNGISTPIIKKGQSIDCRLNKLGLKDTYLDYVIFSHMDFDHTSGLRLVKNAKHVMASSLEIKDSMKYFFRYVKSNWSFVNVEPFYFSSDGIGPVGKFFDLFNDGSIILINTPGHTHGLVTRKVKGSDGKYIALAGDTFYTQRNLEEHIIPGFTVSRKLARKSLEYVIGLRKDPDCIGLYANHDPSIKEQVIQLN